MSIARKRTGIAVLGAVTLVLAYPPARILAQQASRIAPEVYSRLQWRHIGPEGNRISAVAGVVGQPLVYYAGSASGGIHKTTDGGITWEPIFDSTARAFDRRHRRRAVGSEHGLGRHRRGVHPQPHLGRRRHLQVDRRGPIVDAHGPREHRPHRQDHRPPEQPRRRARVRAGPRLRTATGARRVTARPDGGKTWERVLFVDENTGCSELDMDPTNPRKLFAGMWQVDIKTWGRESGGPGSGLFTSNDGGTTWTRLRGQGLPTREVGKVKVAIAPSNPNRVYAMIETGDGIPWKGQETDRGQVWRSEDGGGTWRVVSYDRNAMGRAHYYSHIFVSPDNENEAYFLTASYAVSLDGGQTLALQRTAPARRAATITTCGSIPTNAQSHDRRPRSGLLDLTEPRPHVVSQSPAERADVPRHRRQPDSLQRLRQQAGRPVVSRPEQQPPRRLRRRRHRSRAACGTRWPAARAAGQRPIRSIRI